MATNKISILLSCKLHRFLMIQHRFSCKISVDIDKNVMTKLEKEEIKPRHHPGVVKTGQISLPPHIVKGIIRCTGDYPVKNLLTDGHKLSKYIQARHPPREELDFKKKLIEIEAEVDRKLGEPNFEAMTETEVGQYKSKRSAKIKKLLNQRMYNWKSLNYGQYEALLYAVGRGAQEYAVLVKILKEIAQRDPNFQPRSYFDFGSGVGTGMWATSVFWKNNILEYCNVDASRDMNDLSDLLLREGSENKETFLRNVFYRQFLPAMENSYDLVLSAYTLFELPSAKHRREVLLNLWGKCSGYLILVEEGTRHGFELIAEARKLISGLNSIDNVGHVFSPCPHDLDCPRLETDSRTPCNFEMSFQNLPLGSNPNLDKARYSYVILKKGIRKDTEENDWPRIIRPTMVRCRHTICELCTSRGKLQQVIFTSSKHGKVAYHCARSSKWGDRLPIIVGDNTIK